MLSTSARPDKKTFEKQRANAEVPMSAFFEKYSRMLDALRDTLDPKNFSGIYPLSTIKSAHDTTKKCAEKIWGEKTTEGAQLEVAIWHMQEIFRSFGADVRLVPTAHADDIRSGTDFVFEWKPPHGAIARIGIDVTTNDREKKEADDIKKIAHLQENNPHFEKNFQLGGALRRIAFFKSDFTDHPGYTVDETGNRERGLWAPHVIAAISKIDLYQYCIDLYDGKRKTLKDPAAFLQECPNHPFFEAVRASIIDGIDRELTRLAVLGTHNPTNAEKTRITLKQIRACLIRPLNPHAEKPSDAERPTPAIQSKNIPAVPSAPDRARNAARALEEKKRAAEIEKIQSALTEYDATERKKRSIARTRKKLERTAIDPAPQIGTLLKKKLLRPKDTVDAIPSAVDRYRAQKKSQKERIASKLATNKTLLENADTDARARIEKHLAYTPVFQSVREEPKHQSLMEKIRTLFGWSKEAEEERFELQSALDDGEAAIDEFGRTNNDFFSTLEHLCAPADIGHARKMTSAPAAAIFLKKKLAIDREAGKISEKQLRGVLDTLPDTHDFDKKLQFNKTDLEFIVGLQSELYEMKNPTPRSQKLFETIMQWDYECDLLAEISAKFRS